MFNRRIIFSDNSFEYGGTGADGELTVSADVTISGGVKNYTTVIINAGCTLTIASNCLMYCKNSFTNNGTVTVTPCGGNGGNGGKWNQGEPIDPGKGGSGYVGGAGGAGYNNSSGGGATSGSLPQTAEEAISNYGSYKGAGGGGSAYRYYSTPQIDYHLDGGKGGIGGGGLVISSKTITNSGIINAKGAKGDRGGTSISYSGYSGAGGGGGVIIFITTSYTMGTLTVSGGSGHSSGSSGQTTVITL